MFNIASEKLSVIEKPIGEGQIKEGIVYHAMASTRHNLGWLYEIQSMYKKYLAGLNHNYSQYVKHICNDEEDGEENWNESEFGCSDSRIKAW